LPLKGKKPARDRRPIRWWLSWPTHQAGRWGRGSRRAWWCANIAAGVQDAVVAIVKHHQLESSSAVLELATLASCCSYCQSTGSVPFIHESQVALIAEVKKFSSSRPLCGVCPAVVAAVRVGTWRSSNSRPLQEAPNSRRGKSQLSSRDSAWRRVPFPEKNHDSVGVAPLEIQNHCPSPVRGEILADDDFVVKIHLLG
jgi:hypothetical protein